MFNEFLLGDASSEPSHTPRNFKDASLEC